MDSELKNPYARYKSFVVPEAEAVIGHTWKVLPSKKTRESRADGPVSRDEMNHIHQYTD